MKITIFDLFTIGIGPSSSHTIGPMRAAKLFAEYLDDKKLLGHTSYISIELHGSLAHTGKGHGTDNALLFGLQGEEPDKIDLNFGLNNIAKIHRDKQLKVLAKHLIKFDFKQHLIFNLKGLLPHHPNGLKFSAFAQDQKELYSTCYYSDGGGFVFNEDEVGKEDSEKNVEVVYPFSTAAELLAHCKKQQASIAEIVMENEKTWWSEAEIDVKLQKIWQVMEASITKGCATKGILPGGLKVKRRAPDLLIKMQQRQADTKDDHLDQMNWINLYAMAVSEENAASGRIVTAPTNGSAGILPAIFKYYCDKHQDYSIETVRKFFLTAGAIGLLFKKGASISGAEVGCQGEVGVASSMAAGALTAILGGSPKQVEKAAEIAIEHHLGMTCCPIKGLVQIPCIERNAMGAVKALNAANIALIETEEHKVSLDLAIKTMKATGEDMSHHYKETGLGGLAKNYPEC